MTNLNQLQANYSRGWWNDMKRFRISKLPRWIKPEPAPAKGLQISKVLLATTILLPLMLVGSDMVSDGSVLGQMWQHTGLVEDLTRKYSGKESWVSLSYLVFSSFREGNIFLFVLLFETLSLFRHKIFFVFLVRS